MLTLQLFPPQKKKKGIEAFPLQPLPPPKKKKGNEAFTLQLLPPQYKKGLNGLPSTFSHPINRPRPHTWSDGDHADPQGREVAGDGQRHAHNAPLGGRVGSLPHLLGTKRDDYGVSPLFLTPLIPRGPAHLPLEGGHAGGVDHQAPVAVGVGGVLAHQAGAEAGHVEGSHQVYLWDMGGRC